MKHSVKIIFGKEQVNKFILDTPLSKEEKDINEKIFYFKSKGELNAFIKGVDITVGWSEVYSAEIKTTN
jgi:hypothetical protein